MGTRNAGEFVRKYIDRDARFGRIEPGYSADLILVEGNPLDDVRNACKLAGVAVAGQWMDKSELDAPRMELAERYEEWNELIHQLDEALQWDGAKDAVRQLLATHRDKDELVSLIRNRRNSAGHTAASEGELDHAYNILELGMELFPESANAWDSLGEITLLKGNRDKAIKYYEKALEIDPEFSSAKEQLRRLQK